MKFLKGLSSSLLAVLLPILLTACSGSGDGGNNSASPITESNGSVVIAKRMIQSGEACANGGIEVDMGIDDNNNGQLDPDEITSTETVCHGQSSLVSMTPSNDPSCQFGGTNINVGMDINGNGILDIGEVTDSTLICHTQSSVESEEFKLSDKGSISGALDLDLIAAPKTIASSSIQPFEVTSQAGTLWLTPNEITSAIQADQEAEQQSQISTGSETQLSPPVVIPMEISVAADGSYSIEVPAGTDYSLNYVTTDGSQGIKIEDVNVSPNQTIEISIASQDLTATGSMSFVVQNLANSSVIEGAEVTLLNDATNTLTDVHGSASFEGLAEGSYTVLVESSGFISQTFSAQVRSGETIDLGVLQLNSEKGSASGSVSVDTSLLTSLENIVVYARDTRGSVYTTLTNSSGVFSFNALPVGKGYSFIAQANDFSSSKIENVEILRSQGNAVGQIELKTQANTLGSISGYARFFELKESLNQHAGILVSIEGTDKEAVSSRDGAYIINGLQPGSYILNFTDSNHVTITKENITVVATATTSLAPVLLESKLGSIRGSVLDAQGSSIANVQLILPKYGLLTVTDESGLFNLQNVPVGTHKLIVNKDGYEGLEVLVTVSEGQEAILSDMNIDAYVVAGRVSLQGASDHSGVVVSVIGNGLTTQSDSQGNFEIYGLSAGNYKLQLSKAGYVTETIPLAVASDTSKTELTYTVDLLQAKGVATGIVTLEGRIAHGGVQVSIPGTEFSTYTDNLGQWRLELPIGNYSQGLLYQALQYGTQAVAETLTILQQGEYAARPIILTQKEKRLAFNLFVDGACEIANIQLTGTSGLASGQNLSLDITGENVDQLVSIGRYDMEVSCAASGWETIEQSIEVLADGASTQWLDDIQVRQRFVKINQGALATNNPAVVLQINAPDAASMQIIEGANQTGFIPYAQSHNWTLAAGDGVKTITVNLQDSAGQALESIQASIELDQVLEISSFTATGASTRGEVLTLVANLNGETDVDVKADLAGLFSDLVLFDNGLNGDAVANDGTYTRRYEVTSSADVAAMAQVNAVDSAGNTASLTSALVNINSAPLIQDYEQQGNADTGELFVNFKTDELATTTIYWSTDPQNFINSQVINNTVTTSHNVQLTGLSNSQTTFIKVVATDGVSNSANYFSETQLAPGPLDFVRVVSSAGEIAALWKGTMDPDIVGYHVYRSENNGGFVKITLETPNPSIYYMDTQVIQGSHYQYRVTRVDKHGNESLFTESREISLDPEIMGPTDISLIENNNPVWLPSMNPITLTQDVNIDEGNTLYLLPGAELHLDNYDINGQGGLLALGSENARVKIIGGGSTSKSNNQIRPRAYSHLVTKVRLDDEPISGVAFNYADFSSVNVESQNTFQILNSIADDVSLSVYVLKNSQITNLKTNSDWDYYKIRMVMDSSISGRRASNDALITNVTFINVINSQLDTLNHVDIENLLQDSTLQTIDHLTLEGEVVSSSIDEASELILTSLFKGYDSVFQSIGSWVCYDAYNLTVTDQPFATKVYMDGMSTYSFMQLCGSNTPRLYDNFISSLPISAADFDQDGTPDYLDEDDDNDGFSDLAEKFYGSSQFDALAQPNISLADLDTDLDSILDSADPDIDNDGITNEEEALLGTSSYLMDSDGDGAFDGWESRHNYDPLDPVNHPVARDMDLSLRNIPHYMNASNELVMLGSPKIFRANLESIKLKISNVLCGIQCITSNNSFYFSNLSNGSWQSYTGTYLYDSWFKNIQFDLAGYFYAYRSGFRNIELLKTNRTEIDYSEVLFSSINSPGTYSDYSFFERVKIDSSGTFRFLESQITDSYLLSSYADRYKSSNLNKSTFEGSVLDIRHYLQAENDTSVFNNAYITTRSGVRGGNYLNSDIFIEDDIYTNNNNSFFSDSYLSLETEVITSLGTPEDRTGDGVADTVITRADGVSTLTIDGMNNPRSTPHFPNGISDLWNDAGVGTYNLPQ